MRPVLLTAGAFWFLLGFCLVAFPLPPKTHPTPSHVSLRCFPPDTLETDNEGFPMCPDAYLDGITVDLENI